MKGVTTKRAKAAMAEMMSIMDRLHWDMQWRVTTQGRLPEEWTRIWRERSHRKTRVTIRVDEDVARYFRSMGDGHGPRMNGVLRSFMLAQLAGLIEHDDLPAKYREEWMDKPRPRIATTYAEALANHGLDQAFIEDKLGDFARE